MKTGIVILFILTVSLLSALFSIDAGAATVQSWKDPTSFGLENDHLKLEGDYSHYNHGMPWFNCLLFKDTGTIWTSPWDDVFVLYSPDIYFADSPSVSIAAFNYGSEAKLTYSCNILSSPWQPPSPPVHCEMVISITEDSYIYWTAQLTNIDSDSGEIPIGLTLYTFIAGDTANDHYYVPGCGQGQFVGNQGDMFYAPSESWAAVWDQSKSEGCGIVTTQGFQDLEVAISDLYALTAVPEMVHFKEHNEIALAPGQTSATYDCYYYFFTGTGWQKTKAFFDSVHAAKTPVGGEWIPLDRLQLLAPWVSSALLMIVVSASFVYVKHKKKQQN